MLPRRDIFTNEPAQTHLAVTCDVANGAQVLNLANLGRFELQNLSAQLMGPLTGDFKPSQQVDRRFCFNVVSLHGRMNRNNFVHFSCLNNQLLFDQFTINFNTLLFASN